MECKKDIHFSLDFGWFSVHGRFAEQTKSFNMMKVICRQSLRGWYFFFRGGGGSAGRAGFFRQGESLLKKIVTRIFFQMFQEVLKNCRK